MSTDDTSNELSTSERVFWIQENNWNTFKKWTSLISTPTSYTPNCPTCPYACVAGGSCTIHELWVSVAMLHTQQRQCVINVCILSLNEE